MNTSQETEPLQNALAGLATVMTKMVTERSEQALAESFPAMHPVGDASGRLLKKTQSAELLNVTVRSVDNWMGLGFLPYYKIGSYGLPYCSQILWSAL